MNVKTFFLTSFLLFNINFIISQNTYDIIFPGKDTDQKCQECLKAFSQKPKEVKFSIIRENENLYFEVNDKNWFNLLFKNAGDGLAIEIVSKSRYACELESLEKTQLRGFLLKPVYSKELKQGLSSNAESRYRSYVGKVPKGFLNDELEYNIMFLGNKNLCRYYVIYDLESYSWDLLDMGMYLDNLTYDDKQIKSSTDENYIIRNKTLKFKIPFERNKSNYSQADIKPIYDSLRLTDYNIKGINIKVYSSIEGVASRNVELQELRAKSIVAALQSFQKPTIKTLVSSSENWVDFLNDIKSTKYRTLLILNKKQIKERIAGELSREMEPIFKNHRKAIVELELEKKDKYKVESVSGLLNKFSNAINSESVKEANELQNSIFERIRMKEASPDVLEQMSIPKQVKFANLLSKNSAFKYMLDFRQGLIVYDELSELEKMIPKDKGVRYNLMAIKLKLWRYNAIDVDEATLNKEINALKNYGIESHLIARMLANLHIIKAEKLMQKRDYTNKDIAVEYINNNYKNFTLSNYDYLSLAQFFSYYSNNKLAVKLLENIVRTVDIDEDLLFYYLNLTLIDKELTQDFNYRIVMLNASNMNKERFCKLFNSVENGGITFQLLEDDYLRKTYCESCIN